MPPLSCRRTDIMPDKQEYLKYCHHQNLKNLDRQYHKKIAYVILNCSNPRIDSSGTPNKISAKELYEEFISILCFLPLR